MNLTSTSNPIVPLRERATSKRLGVLLLGERLRRWQSVGLMLACVGVGVQMVAARQVPWIALLLAGTFATYALLRKQMGVGPLVGGIVETLLLLPFGCAIAMWQA